MWPLWPKMNLREPRCQEQQHTERAVKRKVCLSSIGSCSWTERQFALAVNNIMLYNSFLIHPSRMIISILALCPNVWTGLIWPSKTQQHHIDLKGCIRNKKKLSFLCSVLIQSRLFCSVLLLLSLLIHVAKPILKIKLNLFAQPFYWAMRQGSLMLFYGNSDFQSNKQISKEPERNYWTHATHSVWAQETVFDDGKFPFQKHPQTKLKFQKCFLGQICSKFSLEGLM